MKLLEPIYNLSLSLSVCVCGAHSLISMKSCLFSTMALLRLLPSSIILLHINQSDTHSYLTVQHCGSQLWAVTLRRSQQEAWQPEARRPQSFFLTLYIYIYIYIYMYMYIGYIYMNKPTHMHCHFKTENGKSLIDAENT